MSIGDTRELLDILAAKNIINNVDIGTIFDSHDELLSTIDSIVVGDASWHRFSVKFNGLISADSPAWKRQTYVVHTHNIRTVLHNILGTREFNGKFDKIPYAEYTGYQVRRYSNFMSAQWAYNEAV